MFGDDLEDPAIRISANFVQFSCMINGLDVIVFGLGNLIAKNRPSQTQNYLDFNKKITFPTRWAWEKQLEVGEMSLHF